MNNRRRLMTVTLLAGSMAILPVSVTRASASPTTPTSPDPVLQWDEIAAKTVVRSGAFQNEGLVYMAYVSTAVYDAAASARHRDRANRARHRVDQGAAVVEAAYDTLVHYFPSPRPTGSPDLDALHAQALAAVPDGPAKVAGVAAGQQAAGDVIALRARDGRMTPIGVTSPFPTKTPGASVYRLTPAAFPTPQTPWLGNMRPFILHSADQFLPPPPPSLSSATWADAFTEVREMGAATGSARTKEQTDVALFWTANVILQFNEALRDLATAHHVNLLQTARLMAMVNVVAADTQISNLHAKYHYLFWRPVTAIDPTAVTNDGFGPVPGFDDANPATAEQAGWRPLLTTPNHPEYPSAHGSFTSAMAAVFSAALCTEHIDVDIHGFDPAGPAGNLSAVRHFDTTNALRTEVANARIWAGLHYRFSMAAGVDLGADVARYDLDKAFEHGNGCDS
jgi:PAP2 superfamily